MLITLRPIGYVIKGIGRCGALRKEASRYLTNSEILVFEEFKDGLKGIEGFSHLVVTWYMHEVHEVKLRGRPWGREDVPEVGVFATRFPPRPNPLGITVVKLVELRGNILVVRGLDAFTGSPVLDIKPYDFYDVIEKPRVPEWFLRYWRGRSPESVRAFNEFKSGS